MINLLPKSQRQQLQAARANSLFIRYNLALLGVVAFLGIATAVVYFYLSASTQAAQQTISENKAKVASFGDIEARAQEFRNNLAIAKQLLGSEITYSKVTLAIANLMPSGTVLDKLSLDSSTFGTPTQLTAQATSYANALALKDAFQKSALFSDVHFISITTAATGSYPYNVTLSVTIKKDVAK